MKNHPTTIEQDTLA